MTRVANLHKQVIEYFVGLGYSETAVIWELRTGRGRIIDAAIKHDGNVQIIVEIKSEEWRSGPAADFRFDPVVRDLQLCAMEVGARFYVIFDGRSVLWFKTNDVGRPLVLAEPRRAETLVLNELDIGSGHKEIDDTRRRLWQFWNIARTSRWSIEFISAVLLTHLLDERGDASRRESMVQALPQVDRIWDLNGLLGRSPGDRDAIQRAFDVLSTVTFTALDKTVALTLLDEMFLSSVDKEFGVLQIPRWTADLIARLAARRNADRVLDIYGSVGNLSAALRLNGLDARYLEVFVATPQEAAWTFIQQLIVAPDATMPVLVAGNEPAELSPEPPVQFERVVVAPPFGRSKAARLGQYGGAKTLEESFLLRGLKRTARGGRLVALVPSRLLSDPSREKFRREIIERNQLIAVIDLGALLPVSSVAVSALVIEPGISSGAKTFFASAAGLQHEDSFDCRALPSVAEVLQEFLRWDSLRKLPAEYEPSASTRVVLEIAQGTQISPGTYLATNNERDLPISSYPLAALDTVSMIQRGKSIRRRDGDIPFISPSSIRTLSLELDSRDVTTSEEHEAFGGVRARAGDVVINGISTYLGAAALVESGEFAVNRHVFLVRPDHKRILPEYLAIALNSRLVRDALKQEASGSLISGLTTKALQALLIPLPSIAIQRRIVAHVDAVKHCHDEAKLALNARARELQLAVDLLGMEIDQ